MHIVYRLYIFELTIILKTTTMTNAEIILENAVKNLKEGKLNVWEANFVEQFKGFNKKQLKNLTSKQYKTLRDISNK